MDYPQLKRTEIEINVLQGKLGLLRAELKRCQNDVDYYDIKEELEQLETRIDAMQRKYIKGKEAINAV